MLQVKTRIFIYPWFVRKIVDWMITNFHLPQSTLLMMVASFVWFEQMQKIYAHAIEGDYRFYSFWDACLLLPKKAL
jgi:S-adenosylmethionine:tRNA ribosyltransferase-isomerase